MFDSYKHFASYHMHYTSGISFEFECFHVHRSARGLACFFPSRCDQNKFFL